MPRLTAIQWLFVAAAIFDGGLGVAFLLAADPIFDWFDVTEPNHWGYVQFGAAVLVIFGLMFLDIARRPAANRRLILYGTLLKASYAGVVFYHWAGLSDKGVPDMWKPFAIVDLIFGVLFVLAYVQLGRSPEATEAALPRGAVRG